MRLPISNIEPANQLMAMLGVIGVPVTIHGDVDPHHGSLLERTTGGTFRTMASAALATVPCHHTWSIVTMAMHQTVTMMIQSQRPLFHHRSEWRCLNSHGTPSGLGQSASRNVIAVVWITTADRLALGAYL